MENAVNKLSLKLLIDNQYDKVLFGEASKDVVDFIFSFLAKLETLLKASRASPFNRNTNFLLPPSTYQGTKLYVCPSTTFHNNNRNNSYVSEVKGTRCPNCGLGLNIEAKFVDTESNASGVEVGSDGKGYVKGVVTYYLMDDLTVVPMSTISSTALLNKFQIKDLGSLEEKTVTIGFKEGLKILRASRKSKTVLTDVFLKRTSVVLTDVNKKSSVVIKPQEIVVLKTSQG